MSRINSRCGDEAKVFHGPVAVWRGQGHDVQFAEGVVHVQVPGEELRQSGYDVQRVGEVGL